MEFECRNFKPFQKGTLLGFADVFVPKWGVTIFGLTLHEKEGRRWVSFPSKEYEKDGEKKFMPFFRFEEPNHYNLFCDMAKAAIDKKMQEVTKENHHERSTDSQICF